MIVSDPDPEKWMKFDEVIYDKKTFDVFLRNDLSTGDWINFKLQCRDKRIRKRSYWLGYSKTEMRMSNNHDWRVIKEKSKDMIPLCESIAREIVEYANE